MSTLDAAALEARLAELASKHGVVGASVAVMTGDDIAEATTGTANLRSGLPVSAETVFQIGSITKVYTATLVMQLVDQGLVDLDAPVSTYLPELRLADQSAAGAITVRQLLSHTSGIDGDVFDEFGRGDDCVEKYVDAMAALGQTSDPGAFFSYCNAGYVLLGRLVERLRETSWDNALREHLLAPLGLADTVTLPEDAILRSVAVGHIPTGDGGAPEVAPLWHLARAVGPAGAISAKARDVLAFARMHLDDGRATDGTQVLSPAAVKAMQELQVELPDPHTLGEGWAVGWIVYKLAGPPVIGHDGSTIGQQAYMRIVPERDFAVVLLTNGGAAGALFNELVRPILRDETGAELVAPAVPPDPPVDVDVTPFLGTYERSGVHLEIRYDDAADLVFEARATGPLAGLVPDEPPKRLVALDENRLLTAELEERLGQHVVLQFLGRGPEGFRHVHMGGRATPRVGS